MYDRTSSQVKQSIKFTSLLHFDITLESQNIIYRAHHAALPLYMQPHTNESNYCRFTTLHAGK